MIPRWSRRRTPRTHRPEETPIDPRPRLRSGIRRGARLSSDWRTISFASIAATMTIYGQTSGISVFVDPVVEDLGLSRSEVSTAYSIATLLAALALPWIGRQIDEHGVRRVTFVTAIPFGAIVIGLAFTPGLVWLGLGFFGVRLLGQGALSLAARTIVALRFRAELGRAVGLSGAISAVGLSLIPLVLSAVIVAVGWRATWVIGGLSVWLVLIPLSLRLLRPGDDRAPRDRRVTIATSHETIEWTRDRTMRTPIFWVITMTGATTALVLTGLAFHQISILGEAGLSPTRAAGNFIPQTVASIAAVATIGPLSQRIHPRLLLAATMGCLALGTVLLLALAEPWAPVAYALVLGGALGSTQALDGTLYVRYFGRHAIGAIRGAAFTAMIAGAAVGPLLVGVIRDATGAYQTAVPVLLVLPAALAVAAILTPEPPTSRDSPHIVPGG